MSGVGVSVVIPTYNGALYVEQALRSVFAQTLPAAEVIVVDDCSTDDTVALVERLAADAPVSVRLLQMPRNSGGPATPMNRGVRVAASDLVALLDQDDVCAPDRLALHAAGFDNSDLALNFGWVERFDAAGRVPGPFRIDPTGMRSLAVGPATGRWRLDAAGLYDNCLRVGTVFGASNVAFRKAHWEALGGFRAEFRICWDYDFFCRSVGHGPVEFIDARVADYRSHASNLHASPQAAREHLAIVREHYRNPLLPTDRKRLRAFLAGLHWDEGYNFSQSGWLAHAFGAYSWAWRYGEPTHRCLRAVVGMPVRFARNSLGRAAS